MYIDLQAKALRKPVIS